MLTKICTGCKKEKQRTEFYKVKSKSSKDGRAWRCKSCCGEYSKKWRKDNLVSTYGITKSRYQEMLDTRGNKCPICGKDNPQPHIDHDHKTGKVRGLLCGRCNTGIGMLLDNPAACLRAAVYLQSATEIAFPVNLKTLNSIVGEAFGALTSDRRRRHRSRFVDIPPHAPS